MEIIPEEEISDERVQDRQTRKTDKKKKSGLLFYSSLQYQQQQRQQMLLKASSTPAIARPVPTAEVKLAAIAVDLNIRLRSANMPESMQERAFRFTRILVNNCSSTESSPATIPNNNKKNQPRINPTHIAHAIKKEFDASYGPAWHCIVGKSFGSFVTHSPGGFLYFTLDNNLSLLLFKTEVRPLINDKLTTELSSSSPCLKNQKNICRHTKKTI